MSMGWGDRIKKARGNQKQLLFAAQIGIGTTMLSEYEREVTLPRLDTLMAIYRVTGVTPDEIVLGDAAPVHAALDFDILQAVIEAVETDHPAIPPEFKARLAISLYKDRVNVKHKENNVRAVSHVERRKRVSGNPGHGGSGE